MLAPHAEFHQQGPMFDLARCGHAMMPGWVQTLEQESGVDVGLRREGGLLPALTEAEEVDLLKHLEFLTDVGAEGWWMTGRSIREAHPVLSEHIRGGVWLPHEASLNPRALLRALHVACAGRGVEMLTATVEHLEPDPGDEGWIVQAGPLGTISAGHLVVASGAWTSQLENLLGFNLPVRPIKGQLALLDYPDGTLGPLVHRREIYLAPRTGYGIVFGATMEDAGFNTEVNAPVIEEFRELGERLMPCIRTANIIEAWSGLRPCPLDGLPVMGRLPYVNRAYVATGHYRNGILLSGLSGAIMAYHITGDPLAIEIDSTYVPMAPLFDPSRFTQQMPQW
jgi:glycine oxidase